MSYMNYIGNKLFNIIIYLYTIIVYSASWYSKLNAARCLQPQQQSYINGTTWTDENVEREIPLLSK